MNCPTCKNEMRMEKVRLEHTGPLGRVVYIWEPRCQYCEWKGTTGAGKQLRDILKEQ